MMAQSLVKHVALLRWIDESGEAQQERHAAWSAQRATTMAYGRAKSMRLSGQAQAYRILHDEVPTYD